MVMNQMKLVEQQPVMVLKGKEKKKEKQFKEPPESKIVSETQTY